MYIEVWVKAGAKQTSIHARQENIFDISVKERPAEGRANEAVIAVLAKHFDVTKKQVTLMRGASSRRKLFVILQEDKKRKKKK
jgi:uncharacterized protein